MNVSKAALCSFIVLSLFAASCTAPNAGQIPTGSDDNGANCAGTPGNKKDCINNQNRMGDPNP
jgi:hypothetical protein